MKVYTISEARDNLFKIAKATIDTHEPVTICAKNKTIVLMSGEDYSAIQETLYIQSIQGLEESILEGLKEPLSSCATKIEWKSK